MIASDGTPLCTIETGQPTSNVAWGEDGQTLFIMGGSSVYWVVHQFEVASFLLRRLKFPYRLQNTTEFQPDPDQQEYNYDQ